MSASSFGFLTNDDLPSRDEIAALCRQAGYDRSGIPLRKEPDGPILAWVKYGGDITRAEALTQDWVAKALDANPEAPVRVPRVYDYFRIPIHWFNVEFGHIVMQHIDAPDCEGSDVDLVTKAVEWLIRLKGPSSAPGPVGGGPVVHTFFDEWESHIACNTVEELEDHVNGILGVMEDTRRVSFVAEAHHGLYLCPCEIHPGNFKKVRDGKVVALDFGATCFLPRSFFVFTMARRVNSFAFKVAQRLTYPPSGNVSAMMAASYYLVPHGTNNIGLPESILARMRR